MSQIFSFPSIEDRQLVQLAITGYAGGKIDLSSMASQVTQIFNRYNISKLPMNGYTVKVDYYLDTSIVIVEGKDELDRCPVCQSSTDHARYLRTHQENTDKDFDVITVFCLQCGAIYNTRAPNGRVAIW